MRFWLVRRPLAKFPYFVCSDEKPILRQNAFDIEMQEKYPGLTCVQVDGIIGAGETVELRKVKLAKRASP